MSKIVLSLSVAAYYFHTAFMHPNFTVHEAGTSLDWDGDTKVCLFKQHINQYILSTWQDDCKDRSRTSFILSSRSCEIGSHPTSDVGRKEMFYLTTHSTHFIYRYMASDIWLRTNLIVTKETRCRHIGYSFRLTAMVLLYTPTHRQDSTYHGLCYTSRGALTGTRNR